MPQLEHWLKPLEGQENKQFDYTSKLIELPDLNSPGSWSLKYKDRLDNSLIEVNNFKVLSGRLNELYTSSKRNRYFWSLSIALYNLQITAPRILLALKESDSADKIQRNTGIQDVKIAINEFQQAWAEVKLVYGQTRFISNPANYVPDRYFHTASQREDLSWMIQPEEMYFGMIDKWLQSRTGNTF